MPYDYRGREPQPQLRNDAVGHVSGFAALAPGEQHGEVGREIAVAGVAGALEDELEPVGAEPGGHPLELGADRVAHSFAAFPPSLPFAGLDEEDSGFALLSDPPAAPVPSLAFAGFSLSGFRGPLPSLP